MKVRFIRGTPGHSKSNIMFPKSWPMNGGKFPKDHPCASNPEPMIFGMVSKHLTDDPLDRFRAIGYDASCFPEGDGICFKVCSKTDSAVMGDIRECFGWEVYK